MNKREVLGKGLQYFFQACFVLVILVIGMRFKKGGIEGLVLFLERNYILSIVILLILYILKSFMLFVPVSIICIAVSIVFPPFEALLINIIGYFISVLVGYAFGAGYGKSMVEKHLSSKKKIMEFLDKMGDSRISTVMLVRFVPCFPNDIMSMFFGAVQLEKKDYLIGSLTGFLPWLFIYSFVGGVIYSPAMLQILMPMVLICLFCVGGTFTYLKRTQR